MLISMAFAPVPWRSDRRTAACFALSLAAHAAVLSASLPSLWELPRRVLPPMEVRIVEIPPPSPSTAQVEPIVETPAPQAEAVEAAAPKAPEATPRTPEIALERESARPLEPKNEELALEAPLSESEKAKLNPRYLAEAAVDRKAASLDDRRELDYPAEAMQQGITGCVLVMVYIGASGAVEDVDVVRADPPEVFDRAAMRAFIRARYLPALKDGVAVPSRVPGVASFELEGKPQPYCALRYFPVVTELNGKPITLGKDAR